MENPRHIFIEDSSHYIKLIYYSMGSNVEVSISLKLWNYKNFLYKAKLLRKFSQLIREKQVFPPLTMQKIKVQYKYKKQLKY